MEQLSNPQIQYYVAIWHFEHGVGNHYQVFKCYLEYIEECANKYFIEP